MIFIDKQRDDKPLESCPCHYEHMHWGSAFQRTRMQLAFLAHHNMTGHWFLSRHFTGIPLIIDDNLLRRPYSVERGWTIVIRCPCSGAFSNQFYQEI